MSSNRIALSAAFTLVMTVPNLSPFIIVAIMGSLGLNETDAGILLTLEIAALSLTPILLGPKAPQFDLKKLLIIGAVVCLLGNVGSLFVSDIVFLSALRIISGFGAGLLFLGVNIAVSHVSDPVKLFGFVNTAALIVALVLFFFLPDIVDNYGLVGTYGLLTVITIIALPLILKLPELEKIELFAGEMASINISPARIFILLVAIFSVTAAYMTLYVFAEPIGVSSGFTRSEMGVILAAIQIAAIAGTSTATWLGLRFGTFKPLFFSLVGIAVTAVLCTVVQSTIIFVVAFTLINFFFLFALPYQLGIGAQLDHTGKLASIGAGTLYLGISISPFLGGYLLTQHGQISLGVINCIAVVLGLFIYWNITRDLKANSLAMEAEA